jgi:acetyl-CoA acetyltransferase
MADHVSLPGLRGATAIVGVGQTPYYKRGTAPEPELSLCLRAIVAACEDAGIAPEDVDGFVSYGADNNSGPRLMTSLGTRDLRFSTLVWNGGGGGIPGALGVAASAVIARQADCVAVYRAMAEGTGGRLRDAVMQDHVGPQYTANGIDSPAQICALRTQRLLEADGVPHRVLRDLAKASYHHAKRNPLAYGRTTELDDELYDEARWISEPLRLFDCSRENDAGAAVLVVSAARARELHERAAYILSAPMGSARGWAELEESSSPYSSSGFESVARRLWKESGYGPNDVDVVQVYENFTGPGVAALIDHGFCTPESAGEVLTFENLIAPSGGLPVNTSGGNLAEGFIHGMGLVVEAARQLRGDSPNQVPGASLSLMTGGPGAQLVSSALLGSEATL